ncbi:MAG: GNAT family N-acetyltransferase [Oscillospiraceae bacterium]|nr:GNAT family N-acetyltransferase [Oscillospiraceae bacterium]
MKAEIRIISTPEEFLQARINSAIAFNYQFDVEAETNKEPLPYADVYGAFVNGRLVANIYAHRYKMMCHGTYVPMCGIGEVNTLIEFRNKGYIRQLMNAVFDDIQKAGYVYSFLYPFSYKYYGMFGYGPGGSHISAEIPTERLDRYKCTYDVKLYEDGDSYQPYEEVFDKFAKQYTGQVVKNGKWLSGYNPMKTGKSMYLFTENGVPKAFLGYENFYHKGGHLVTDGDIAWDSAEAFENIMGFIYKLRMHNDVFKVVLPDSLPVEAMLNEPWGLKLERNITGQVRLIDTAAALKLYPWGKNKGTVIIGVRDDYYKDQSGSYQINFSDTVTVEKTSKNPDAEFDTFALSPLLMGVFGFDDLAFLPEKSVKINGNIPLLQKLFIRRPVFVTERF